MSLTSAQTQALDELADSKCPFTRPSLIVKEFLQLNGQKEIESQFKGFSTMYVYMMDHINARRTQQDEKENERES